MDNLGIRIREIRERLGLNQTEVAEKLGLGGPAAVSKYEKNQREPEIDILIKISKLGNRSLDWLLTGEGPIYKEGAKRPVEIKDIPKENIKEWLDEFWGKASDKERAWLEIEFERTFPEYKEWLQKKQPAHTHKDEEAEPEIVATEEGRQTGKKTS